MEESGKQIGKKLLVLLNEEQKTELTQFFLEGKDKCTSTAADFSSSFISRIQQFNQSSTEIHVGDLYFCLEQRKVIALGRNIKLTAKEFDIFALLIMNPKRVFTYEMIMEIIWPEDFPFYSRKTVNSHVSNLRRKLKVTSDIPDYIKSIYSVGYKFDDGL